MADTNWDICFICVVSKDNVRSGIDVYKTLAKNISAFHKKITVGFHFERISKANLDLLPILATNKTVYHHNCFLQYSNLKLKRLNELSKKRKSTEDGNGKKSTRFLAESRERFELFYCWSRPSRDISGNKINHEI